MLDTSSGNAIGSGGLTVGTGAGADKFKQGTGELTLSGANTYSGTTVVSNGTLLVNGTHSGAGQYTIASGATLGGTGVVEAAIASLSGGILAPGNSIGAFTLDGDADLDGILQIEIDGDLGISDLFSASGLLDITNATLQLVISGSLTNDFYVFANYDTLAGPFFDEGTLPSGYFIDYNFGAGQQIALAIIPEPGAMGLLAIGGCAILAAARRRATTRRQPPSGPATT